MDRKLDLDAERDAALKRWQSQNDDIERLLSLLQACATAFDAGIGSFDDWTARTAESKRLLGESWTTVERLDRLLKVRKRLEKAFTKKVHKIEVMIGVSASRRIGDAKAFDAESSRASSE